MTWRASRLTGAAILFVASFQSARQAGGRAEMSLEQASRARHVALGPANSGRAAWTVLDGRWSANRAGTEYVAHERQREPTTPAKLLKIEDR